MILRGEIAINGRVVRELGTSVAQDDVVSVRGRRITPVSAPTYLVVHKPLNVMTTMHDPQGRRTIASLLPKEFPRVVPVGRLDYDTSGVLLMTNDGRLAYVLTHPKFGVRKTYRVTVAGRLQALEIKRLRDGLPLSGIKTAGAALRALAVRSDASIVDLTIHEGRNRQVRRMFEALGHPVLALARIRFGPIKLGQLPPGEVRPASLPEIAALRALAANEIPSST
jgi:pseudouridine synthase